MSFFECQFPTTIEYRAVGGPGFNTTVNDGQSGAEQRNRNWAFSRGKWTISMVTPQAGSGAGQFSGSKQNFVDLLEAFFLNVGGRADAFRLKDHKDFQATGQTLAHISGNNYQLQKTYTIGGRNYVRTITKPIWGTVNDWQGNALANTVVLKSSESRLTYGSGWTLDATTGIVTTSSTSLTADFQFHFPVRFDTDELPVQIHESDVAGGNPIVSIDGVNLIEVPPPNY
ncbi:MAG TPA: DUF2460 domain-containing protein [Candidatus Acidoferrum sp.]|jgi:uncharacterized protein (TIGR02217 family)|nr:DUF2460 domain-containing protein [Candidatus Acidoferrum sp.]